MKPSLLCLSVASLAIALAAQDVAIATTPDAPTPDLGATPFLTPIRTVAPDSAGGRGAGGGRWASGANYKVALDDGIAIYPVLGEGAPKNLPLRWRTRNIAVGAQSVLGPLAMTEVDASDWRYELRHGAVTEAYDVRNDGVEQTFVLHARPAPDGDLVITGDIETELSARPSAWQHGEVTFCDAAGNPRVRYGAATAIDADGRSVAMETSYDGHAISLRLGRDWLAAATFPVVVDPLLTATTLITHLSPVNDFDVARDDGSNQLMIVFRRASAANDYDGFGMLVDDDFGAAAITVFADIDAAWSTKHLSVAFVGGTNKWILALERSFPAAPAFSYLRYRLHASGDPTPSTVVTFVGLPANESWAAPEVGGSLASGTGNQALIVFRADYPFLAPDNSDVYGMLVNTGTTTEGARFSLAGGLAGATFDRGSVRVNKESGGANASWVAAFTEINRTVANDDIDIDVVRVATNGGVTARVTVPSPSSDHKVAPAIDGRDGRYVITHGLRAFGHGIAWLHTVVARRFDFAEGAATPSFGPASTLASAGEYYVTDIAYDSRTRSHWVATYYTSAWDIVAKRMGYDAGVAETATVYDGPGAGSAPSVCFNDDARHFHIVYPAVEGALNVIRARTLAYPVTAATLAASGCGGSISANDTPYAGHEFFAVEASGLQSLAPAVLLCALTPANLPLAALHMPGCSLLLAPETLLFTFGTGANAAGQAQVTLPLPTRVAGIDLHFQWAHVLLGANPANLLATRRLSVPIR